MSRCLTVLLSLALALPAGHALAAAPAKDDAEAHFERAAEHYAKEDYAEAAREFSIAYALEPSIDIMFAWAQSERLAGNLEQAAELYGRLLAEDELADEQREALEQLLAEVEAELPDEAPEEPDSTTPTQTDSVDEPTSREGPDTLGIALSAAGGGLTLLGVGLLAGGRAIDSRVLGAETYQDFASNYDRNTGRARGAVPLYAVGGVSLGVGIGVLVAGIVRLTKGRPEAASARRPAISPWLGPARAGIGVRWKL